MAYALFAQRKVVLTGNINSVSLQQTQRSNEQYLLATHTLSLQQQMTSLQASQASELADLYKKLSNVGNDGVDTTNFTDAQREQRSKDLETARAQISALQKQLEAVEEAESSAIDRATPKFKGVG